MINIFCEIRNKLLFKYNNIKYYKNLGVEIGKNTHIINSNIDTGHAYLISIGNNTTLTNCTILAHDASTKKFLKKTKVGQVKIGNNCFIGWGAIILPCVKIGDNCIIGAGTVITKDVPSESIVVGNPSRIIGKTEDFIKKHKEYMKEKPVFDKYWENKTKTEKFEEKRLLENTFGYDE